jgi:hypothetical protein
MAFSSKVLFLFIFVINTLLISGQQVSMGSDQVYGSDPLLYNGRYYTFYPPLNTGGSQYLSDRQFETGSVTLRGITYSNLLLNYDIYNQELILKYQSNTGAVNLIIVSDAWLQSFNIRGMKFEVIATQDTMKKIYQVLGEGKYRVYYYWSRKLNLDSFYGSKNFVFSSAGREMNLFNGQQIMKYNNNRSFYSLFDQDKRNNIKEYLRANRIKIKKVNDQIMNDLILYCNSLYIK